MPPRVYDPVLLTARPARWGPRRRSAPRAPPSSTRRRARGPRGAAQIRSRQRSRCRRRCRGCVQGSLEAGVSRRPPLAQREPEAVPELTSQCPGPQGGSDGQTRGVTCPAGAGAAASEAGVSSHLPGVSTRATARKVPRFGSHRGSQQQIDVHFSSTSAAANDPAGIRTPSKGSSSTFAVYRSRFGEIDLKAIEGWCRRENQLEKFQIFADRLRATARSR